MNQSAPRKHHHHHHPHPEDAAFLQKALAPDAPTWPTAESYRIAGYTDGMVGAVRPECDRLLPHFDSGLKWADENNPQPDDPLWDGGVAGGVTWDGTFYRDLNRFAGGGSLFWCAYLKPGSAAGDKKGFWLNFGSGWAHLCNDDPSQLRVGAAQYLCFDAGEWRLVIQATEFVTGAVIDVWTGHKTVGTDPVGTYTRLSGCDPAAAFTIEANL